jgi:hypothetical protein
MFPETERIGDHDRILWERRENPLFDIQHLLREKVQIQIIGLGYISSRKI